MSYNPAMYPMSYGQPYPASTYPMPGAKKDNTTMIIVIVSVVVVAVAVEAVATSQPVTTLPI